MSVWKSDEKLLSICILNFSFKNDFVWEEISNIRHSVSSPDETLRLMFDILLENWTSFSASQIRLVQLAAITENFIIPDKTRLKKILLSLH